MRDFHERRLLELVERQKHSATEMKDQKQDNEIESKQTNTALKIIEQAKTISSDYFNSQ